MTLFYYLLNYFSDKRATTSIEYALIAVAVAFGIVIVVLALGETVFGFYSDTNAAFEDNI